MLLQAHRNKLHYRGPFGVIFGSSGSFWASFWGPCCADGVLVLRASMGHHVGKCGGVFQVQQTDWLCNAMGNISLEVLRFATPPLQQDAGHTVVLADAASQNCRAHCGSNETLRSAKRSVPRICSALTRRDAHYRFAVCLTFAAH